MGTLVDTSIYLLDDVDDWSPPVPRKDYSVFLIVPVLIVAVGSCLVWLNRPLLAPSVTGLSQITHDGLVKTNLASDGSNLYFTEISGDRSVISKVAATGGSISEYPLSFPSAQLLDVSAAHASMLAAENTAGPSAERPVWLSPLQGGAARRFGVTTGQEVVWS